MRVWMTRDEPPDGPLSTALRKAGLESIYEPVISRRVFAETVESLRQLNSNDWLILTSPFAIQTVPEEIIRIPRIAVVGEISRSAAEAKGARVELMSQSQDAAGLWEALRATVTTGNVYYPRSSKANAPTAWANINLISPVLYGTVARSFDLSVMSRVDVVAVASPSAVAAITEALTGKERAAFADLTFASIGPTTSLALCNLGVEPWTEAEVRSLEGLAQAIAEKAGAELH